MDLETDIEEATVNVLEFARVVGVSDQTVRNWMRTYPEDFPVATRGSHGVPYEIPLKAGVEWVKQHQAEAEEARASRVEQLDMWREQVGLAGGDDTSTKGLTAQERKAEAEAELVLMRVRRERGELVERARLEVVLSAAFVGLRKGLTGIPLQFAKRVGLPSDQRILLESMGADCINATVERIKRELGEDGEDSAVA